MMYVQERMQGLGKSLEELSSLVGKLRLEKQELQQRARILESSLAANTHHEERLHCDEVQCLTQLFNHSHVDTARILESVLAANMHHEEHLHCNEVC